SMILGILAFLICWIPLVGAIGFPLSALGLLLGVPGVVIALCRKGRGIGFPIAGLAISALAAWQWYILMLRGCLESRHYDWDCCPRFCRSHSQSCLVIHPCLSL